ncbi:hypothetical protein Sjap_021596 [Stephania japonica]|uniref:Beta-galactosidase n=1 Tax=Stephania japonica TaxID=461633 RepID=A0AAP0EW35_9MAGN
MAAMWLRWAAVMVIVAAAMGDVDVTRKNIASVSYDGRSLLIGGQRRILFSGSIHYPRSTPEMWPSLISKAKEGGIDVIQTYVFWNLHEPQPGQYNFDGRNDLVKFIKEVQSQGLYVTLRIGPFIESEWTYGGFPFWLHDVKGIVYRSDNEPFKFYMQNFTTKIVKLMKSENLYASQGGPIILSQIENEYKNVEGAFHEKGPPYVRWAAKMAVDLQTGVPWVMCKQDDAPDPVINACNGMNCGETFAGPNSPKKPALWTENWTSFYQVFGGEPYIRSAEDIAFAVALFIARKNGSYINYYMYHGGTNFGRIGSSYVLTSYYDQAPLDEYGLLRQPKWGHLKELHAAIKSISNTLLEGTRTNFTLAGQLQEAYVFQGKSNECATFLVNNDKTNGASVQYQNSSFYLPPRSICILSDCKTVAFNTSKTSAPQNPRSFAVSQTFDLGDRWQVFKDVVPNFGDTSTRANGILEHMSTTKDVSDYLWYTFSFERAKNDNSNAVLHVYSLAHVLHAFVNGKYAGSAHGSHDQLKAGLTLDQPILLNEGVNNISLLSVMVGLPDSGAFLERRVAGLRRVTIESIKSKKQRVFNNYEWGYQVGLLGESQQIYTEAGTNKVQWSNISSASLQQPLTWYKTTFDAPQGEEPVALNLSSMGKGEAWINGQSIGRYWPSFYTPKGRSSQELYHIPRSFLKSSGNLLVLEEEMKGDPSKITLVTVNSSANKRVCGKLSDSHLASVLSPETLKKSVPGPKLRLECPPGMAISKIVFASFGTPSGDCNSYAFGKCHSSNSTEVAEVSCLGRQSCSLPKSMHKFGGDPCPGIPKSLLVVAQCE